MKKVVVPLLILFLIIISCNTQHKVVEKYEQKELNYIPYYLKVYEADSLHIVGNYKNSQQILDSLFKKFEPLNQESYGEYITYLKNKILLGDYKKIDKFLKIAIENYGFKVEYCIKDSLINIGVKKAKFKEQDLKKFYETYLKSLDLEYRYSIEKMIEDDQRVRLSVIKDNDEWKKVDKKNAENIKVLIEKYGYPSISKIGRYDINNKNSNIHVLFLHSTKEARESYILNLMLESVKKGECEPSAFASVYDKYLRSTGKYGDKVFYGELRNSQKKTDELVVNPNKIDSIRSSIGLEHLEYKIWKLKKLTGINVNNQ